MMAQQADISYAINRKWIGSVQDVLIEEKSDHEGCAFIGRCRRQAPEIDGVTYIRNHNTEIGRIIKCKITAADHYDLYGEIL